MAFVRSVVQSPSLRIGVRKAMEGIFGFVPLCEIDSWKFVQFVSTPASVPLCVFRVFRGGLISLLKFVSISVHPWFKSDIHLRVLA